MGIPTFDGFTDYYSRPRKIAVFGQVPCFVLFDKKAFYEISGVSINNTYFDSITILIPGISGRRKGN